MLKLLRLGMVVHSKPPYLAALLPSGTPVCSLTVSHSGGSAWNQEQNDGKAADRGNQTAIMHHQWEILDVFDPEGSLYWHYDALHLGPISLILS